MTIFSQHVRNRLFTIESKMLRKYNRMMRRRLTSYPYVSGDGFRNLSDHVFEDGRYIDAADIRDGDVVFVETHHLMQFMDVFLPKIRHRFVLISHNSDDIVDNRFEVICRNTNVVIWLAQNAVYKDPSIIPVPIGLENRWWHKNGILGDFNKLINKPSEKSFRMLYGFTVENNSEERAPALMAFQNCDIAVNIKGVNPRDYRKKLAEYAFVASPPGNGPDCHRTWEALYLGTIPIVKKSSYLNAFEKLPIVQLNKWQDLDFFTEKQLEELYAKKIVELRNTRIIWMDYWIERIAEYRQQCK